VFLAAGDLAQGGIMPTTEEITFAYSDDFVARVKEAFPEYARLHELLDENSTMAGHLLDNSRTDGSISLQRVLNALNGDLDKLIKFREELSEEAQRAAMIDELYREWSQVYQAWQLSVAKSRKPIFEL
jgi:hypothetical protein